MSDQLERLKNALTDRYRIERELGVGGMAIVYLAEDLKHERQVALKVLKPELALAIGSDRFLREIKITAALSHPHILPLLDSGEADGFLFYVMPYVEGESLADRLEREKQLPLDDALEIARQVGDALSFAHAQGVIHRDIKPDNILLQAGHAVVTDFGIGRAVNAAGGDSLTETGLSIGTPTYMSPEQAGGTGDVDGRSDLYSLACVLYEMLAGQPPFSGPTVESLLHQHLAADPVAITQIRPAVPAEIAGVLQRALAKNPADRFNPVAQFTDAIRAPSTVTAPQPVAQPRTRQRTIPILVVTAVAVVAAIVFWPRDSAGPETTEGAPSVAVLPFENIGGDPANEYFSDGITEDIIAHVSKLGGIKVISRTSAMQFKGTTASFREIGRQLGVTSVLEGSIRRADNRVRIVAQLIDAETDEHLWVETYDRDLEDIFAIQTDVARNIAAALGTVFGDDTQAEQRAPTSDLEAYDLYLRGRVVLAQRTGDAMREAIDHFRRAIDRDPTFAHAYAALAEAWALFPLYTLTPTLEAWDRLQQAADSALALDPSLPGAHAARGFGSAFWLWDFAEGEASLREAARLDPSYAEGHHWLGMVLGTAGQYDEGLAALRRALELDPLSRIMGTDLAVLRFYARDFAGAEDQFRKVMELDPRFPPAYRRAAWLYAATGRDSLVAEMLERWNVVLGESVFPSGELRAAFTSGGRRGMYEWLLRTATPARVSVADRATWYTALGRHAEALDALERAAEQHEPWFSLTLLIPAYDPLRDEPRFQEMLTRVFGR